LPQFLGDDLRRGVAVQKTVPDDLADGFGCSPIVGLGTAFPALKSDRARALIGGAELKVTLLAEAKLLGGLERPRVLTLPLHEHAQLARDLVVLPYLQATARSDQRLLREIELCHPGILRKSCPLLGLHGTSVRQARVAERGPEV
jgi:hypothetical protein